MKYNVGDIVLVRKEGYLIYAYVLKIGMDSLGMNWYTLKYQIPQRFGGSTIDCTTYSENQMLKYVEKVK
ncbi:MAG: hypothetical protein EBR30_24020 [Cytophagia bacterium]|jgi:hypothetical protein|nr:hypothetical protein [Cytophagia bacterium]